MARYCEREHAGLLSKKENCATACDSLPSRARVHRRKYQGDICQWTSHAPLQAVQPHQESAQLWLDLGAGDESAAYASGPSSREASHFSERRRPCMKQKTSPRPLNASLPRGRLLLHVQNRCGASVERSHPYLSKSYQRNRAAGQVFRRKQVDESHEANPCPESRQ